MSNVRVLEDNHPNFCDVMIAPLNHCSHNSVTTQTIFPPMEKPFTVDVCRQHAGWIAPDEDY